VPRQLEIIFKRISTSAIKTPAGSVVAKQRQQQGLIQKT
jgi:hypothetical protein